MTKFIYLSVIILIGCLSTPLHAQKTLKLSPNETKSLANNSLWTINATCTIQGTPKTKSRVRISVLKNKGKVNGRSLATGQATSITVKNNSSISVSADAGTQINLINLSSEGLQAVCST